MRIHEFEPIVKQSGLDKAENYAAIFAPFMIELKNLSVKAAAITKENPSVLDAKLAREVRLAMARNRTASEKEKDKNKASLIAEGNLIQGLYKVVESASKLSEADLEAIEKFAENKEEERKVQLSKHRADLLWQYETDASTCDLGNMPDEVFANLLESQKLLFEKKKQDAKEAEEKRIADELEEQKKQAAIKAENEKLKKEAAEKEKALKAERAENERLAKIKADAVEKELQEQRAKNAAIAKENQKKLAAIEAENNRLRDKAKKLKEDQDKKDLEEANKKALELEAQRKAAKAPIKEKLKVAIESLKLDLPDSEITFDLYQKFVGFRTWALNKIENI